MVRATSDRLVPAIGMLGDRQVRETGVRETIGVRAAHATARAGVAPRATAGAAAVHLALRVIAMDRPVRAVRGATSHGRTDLGRTHRAPAGRGVRSHVPVVRGATSHAREVRAAVHGATRPTGEGATVRRGSGPGTAGPLVVTGAHPGPSVRS
ncbi:hypothetical protein GCM10009851_14340 [Herbiconiux moechotypicola]|uniref:Uncharacterized protein n=1 Tax=Herbiconiux moechotypicola TaxID=637393 RepID=A0ABN3DGK8_9MICO